MTYTPPESAIKQNEFVEAERKKHVDNVKAKYGIVEPELPEDFKKEIRKLRATGYNISVIIDKFNKQDPKLIRAYIKTLK